MNSALSTPPNAVVAAAFCHEEGSARRNLMAKEAPEYRAFAQGDGRGHGGCLLLQ